MKVVNEKLLLEYIKWYWKKESKLSQRYNTSIIVIKMIELKLIDEHFDKTSLYDVIYNKNKELIHKLPDDDNNY